VWSFIESLDLSQLYERVKSRESEAGRPATDPAVLLSLWLYAVGDKPRASAPRDVQARAGRAPAALERLQAERKARAKPIARMKPKRRSPRLR
jgi:hypothetical protein